MVKSDGSAHWKVAVGSNKTSGVPLNLEFKTRAEGGKEGRIFLMTFLVEVAMPFFFLDLVP
jgi:hypothetical protein